MKLKAFNTETTPCTRTTKPTVRLNLKSGMFGFNLAAQEKLKLKVGTTVAFYQDEDEAENWYIEVGAKNGFVLRKSGNSGQVYFSNKYLCDKIVESVEANDGGRMLFGEKITAGKVEMWTILTASLKVIPETKKHK